MLPNYPPKKQMKKEEQHTICAPEKDRCFICLCQFTELECINCPKIYHQQCIQKYFGTQPNFNNWLCNFCHIRDQSICRTCNTQIKQPNHLEKNNKAVRRQEIQDIQNHCLANETKINNKYMICTYCCCKYHEKCIDLPQTLKNKANNNNKYFLDHPNNTFLCEFCVKIRNYLNPRQNPEIINHDNNQQSTLYFNVRICSISPLHSGWFSQKFLRSLALQQPSPTYNIPWTPYPRIQKIIKIKIPKKYKDQPQQSIYTLLYDRLKSRQQIIYGDINNFKFMVKWRQYGYKQCTWQDQYVVYRQPLLFFRYLNLCAFYWLRDDGVFMGDFIRLKLAQYKDIIEEGQQHWTDIYHKDKITTKIIQDCPKNQQIIKVVEDMYVNRMMPCILMTMQNIKLTTYCIIKQIHAFYERYQYGLGSKVNIFIFVCEQEKLIDFWEKVIGQYFPTRQVMTINDSSFFEMPELHTHIFGPNNSSPKFQFLLINKTYYNTITETLSPSSPHPSHPFPQPNKFQIRCIILKDTPLTLNHTNIAPHILIQHHNNQTQLQNLSQKIISQFNTHILRQYKTGQILKSTSFSILDTFMIVEHQFMYFVIERPYRAMVVYYLVKYGVVRVVGMGCVKGELRRCFPKLRSEIEKYRNCDYWQHFTLCLTALKRMHDINYYQPYLNQILPEIFHNFNPILLYKHIISLQKIHKKLQATQRNPQQFCKQAAKILLITSQCLYVFGHLVMKHGFGEWNQILMDAQYLSHVHGVKKQHQIFWLYLGHCRSENSSYMKIDQYLFNCFLMIGQ